MCLPQWRALQVRGLPRYSVHTHTRLCLNPTTILSVIIESTSCSACFASYHPENRIEDGNELTPSACLCMCVLVMMHAISHTYIHIHISGGNMNGIALYWTCCNQMPSSHESGRRFQPRGCERQRHSNPACVFDEAYRPKQLTAPSWLPAPDKWTRVAFSQISSDASNDNDDVA